MERAALKPPQHVVLIALQSSLVVEKAAGQLAEVLDQPDQIFTIEEAVVLPVRRLVGQNEESFYPLFELFRHGDNPLMLGPDGNDLKRQRAGKIINEWGLIFG